MPQGGQGYNYPSSNQMWTQAPQTAQHGYQGYTTQSQSAHPQQSQAPHLRQPSSGPVQQQSGMQFSGMPGMSQGYAGQAMYAATEQTPRQYMSQSPQGAPAVTQAWSGQQTQAQWWPGQPQ